MKKFLIIILLALPLQAFGQRFALSANLAGYAEGPGTMSLEASYGLSRHFTASALTRYNPFESASEKHRDFALGARWWPWHVYSGWWMAGRAQWQEFASEADSLTEGDRLGASLGAGYSRMLGRHLNLDLGLGLWGGYEKAIVYACGRCGRVVGGSNGFFLKPDALIVALTYVF